MISSADAWSRRRRASLLLGAFCLAAGLFEAIGQHAANVARDVHVAWTWTVAAAGMPWLIAALLVPFIVTLAERHPLDRERWRAQLPWYLAAMIAVAAVHQLGAAFALRPLATGTFDPWAAVMKAMGARTALDVLIFWGAVGVTHALRFSEEARERKATALRLEAGLAEARLAALAAQLNPHFLFNTLNAVSTLAVRGDREGVTHALSVLSDMLRVTLDASRGQEVSLAEELAFLDRYLTIQQLRFGDRLTVTRTIDDDALDALVPAMLLQPLVENAIQHGVAARPGPGHVTLRARRDGEQVEIDVCDSGPGFDGTPREGIGLGSTRARLAHCHGEAHGLAYRNLAEGGACVTVRFPYRGAPG